MESVFNELIMERNADADRLHEVLKSRKIDFASGVPCGVLRCFIDNFNSDSDFIHIPAQNEPEAVGIAAGSFLGGKNPVIYMQNSGLLKSINEIGSLLIPCEIPMLFIVTYRGCEGEDAPQHKITGGITEDVLDALSLYYHELTPENIENVVTESYDFMDKTKRPAVILVKRGWSKKRFLKTDSVEIRKDEIKWYNPKEIIDSSMDKIIDRRNYSNKFELKREEALDAIIKGIKKEDAIFSNTGLISRSLYERYDAPNFFYNVGSFGFVSSIGLGFAIAKKDKRVFVIDGDSSVLTNFGTLVTIGYNKPKNLVHIILDNNAYASCSEEKSCSDKAHFPLVAAIQDYSSVFLVNNYNNLKKALQEIRKISGPVLVHAKIELGGRRNFDRPKDLAYIARRFKNYFND